MTDSRTITFRIDDSGHSCEVAGQTGFGGPECLFEQDDSLLENADWRVAGFVVAPFLDAADMAVLRDRVTADVRARLARLAPDLDLDGFAMQSLHETVAGRDDVYAALIAETRKGFDIADFPVDIARVDDRVSELCGTPVRCAHFDPGGPEFNIRIVRPDRNDNNPPHRDVWLDHLRHKVNIYAPLFGSTRASSLPVLPGSHLWPESQIERTKQGATVNGLAFSVPCVVGSPHGVDMIRPPVDDDEVMVFSPYTIHGGGVNMTRDRTRVSLEMRFERDPRRGARR